MPAGLAKAVAREPARNKLESLILYVKGGREVSPYDRGSLSVLSRAFIRRIYSPNTLIDRLVSSNDARS